MVVDLIFNLWTFFFLKIPRNAVLLLHLELHPRVKCGSINKRDDRFERLMVNCLIEKEEFFPVAYFIVKLICLEMKSSRFEQIPPSDEDWWSRIGEAYPSAVRIVFVLKWKVILLHLFL